MLEANLHLILFPISSTFWATAFAAPLQPRDLSNGAIAQSTLANDNAICTSYLYYGESQKDVGKTRSCFAAAIDCKFVKIQHIAYFVVGSSTYAWNSNGDCYVPATNHELDNIVVDMRGADGGGWICKDGAGAFGELGISTYILGN